MTASLMVMTLKAVPAVSDQHQLSNHSLHKRQLLKSASGLLRFAVFSVTTHRTMASFCSEPLTRDGMSRDRLQSFWMQSEVPEQSQLAVVALASTAEVHQT